MMIRTPRHFSPASGDDRASAFTLIEMLVAVGLVMLMMVLFAQIFQLATASMSTQRGIAQNDQRARMLTVTIMSDFDTRTCRDVKPFRPQLGIPTIPLDIRDGYFSISENDPDDPTDDILSLTIRSHKSSFREVLSKDAEDKENRAPYFGRATLLKDPTSGLSDQAYLLQNTNQPEYDDGQIGSSLLNNTGASRVAEVVYFLRNGVLYRRELLVREPYSGGSAQPNEVTANYTSTIAPASAGGSGQFWRDMDYSAYYKFTGANPGLYFHDWQTSLSNDKATSGVDSDFGFPISLGMPHLRFGHSLNTALGGAREFDSNGAFIGRFTMQETAHSAFGYPGRGPANNDPHTLDTAQDPDGNQNNDNMQLNANGLIQRYSGETFRRGEDILLSGVLEFDIEVWDDGLATPAFVNLGNGGGGHYGTPDPASSYGNHYDTWHPFGAPGTWTEPPPYRPVSLGPNGVTGNPGDDDGDGTNDPPGDPDYGEDTNQNGRLDAGEDTDGDGLLDSDFGYIGTDDEVPLRAIQITIKYRDTASGQIRQLTLVHSLIDN